MRGSELQAHSRFRICFTEVSKEVLDVTNPILLSHCALRTPTIGLESERREDVSSWTGYLPSQSLLRPLRTSIRGFVGGDVELRVCTYE